MAALGVLDGARMLFSAVQRTLRTPSTWPYVLVPSLVFALVSGVAVTLVLKLARPALDRAVSGATASEWVNDALGWVGLFASLLIAILSSLFVTTPLSAPALERLVARTEEDLGAPPRASLGFFREMWCGLRAQVAPVIWTLPAWLLLLIIDIAVPFLTPVTFVLRALLGGFGVAWALIDYPLTLRGVSIRERMALFRRDPRPILGLGGAFGVLFWIPCCGIVFLGIGVIAATELVLTIAERDAVLRRHMGLPG